jgi:hypothetical protein
MTAMLSGVIMIAAFGIVAAAGLVLMVALYRISGRAGAGSERDPSPTDVEDG